MKKILFIIILVNTFFNLFAKQIDEETAKKVGKNFMNSQRTESKTAFELSLVYKASNDENGIFIQKSLIKNYFYIFNCSDENGFVIVSADDIVIPVLAYSTKNSFVVSDFPPNLLHWLQNYKAQIEYAIENEIMPTSYISKEWEELKNGVLCYNIKSSVSPLLNTKWDQLPFYNDLCPDNNTGNHAVTGCVATAMAQVMKFWNYPLMGYGSFSYYDPVNYDQYNNPINGSIYGLLTANFGATTYNWNNMPNVLNSANNDVAKLMLHCGVSVAMNYSVNASAAYVISADNALCAENALKDYFGYSNTLNGIIRSAYTDNQWLYILKNEFNNGRPIIYAGFGTGGHCFVADGYDNTDRIYFNWGWSGYCDGAYYINNLNPALNNTVYNFTNNQRAIIGITPPSGVCNFSLSQYNVNFPPTGGIGNFDIFTSTNCTWSAIPSTSSAWIHINSGPNGNGNGSVEFSIDPNLSSNIRYGSISVEGQNYNITQAGADCIYSLSPSSTSFFSSSGGNGSFNVNTDNNCAWSATSNNSSWLHITSSITGTGASCVYFSVDSNFSANTLIGSITVANQVYTVTVDGASLDCSVTFVPAGNVILGNYQGDYSLVFNINPLCGISVSSSSPDWLTITNVTNNVIYYHVISNNSYFPKTAYISVNNSSIIITQEGDITTKLENSNQTENIQIYTDLLLNTLFIKNVNELLIAEIVNIGGQVIKQFLINNNDVQIDISGLAQGLYLLKLVNKNINYYKKFIK